MNTMEVATVGLRLWKRESMAGLARPPNLSLIVQTLGGELPQWVAPSDTKDEQCDAEFIILRNVPSFHGAGNVVVQALQIFSPKTRVILSSAAMGATLDGGVGLPRADLHIKARDFDLDLVGEALAAVLAGNLLIGVEWADLLLTAGAVRPFGVIGAAVVVEGIHDTSSVPLLHAALSSSDGGSLLVQLVSQADGAKFSLDAIDVFANQVFAPADKRNHCFTASLGTSCSATVLITFYPATREKLPPVA